MTVFPLTRLPLLSIQNVMDICDILSLLRISRCNQKLRNIVRSRRPITCFEFIPLDQKEAMNHLDVLELLRIQALNINTKLYRINPFSIDLLLSTNIIIKISLKEGNGVIWTIYVQTSDNIYQYREYGIETQLKIEKKKAPSILSGSILHTFWSDRLEGLIILLDWTMRSFNFQFETIRFNRGTQASYRSDLYNICLYLKHREITCKSCVLDESDKLRARTDSYLSFVRINIKSPIRHLKFDNVINNY